MKGASVSCYVSRYKPPETSQTPTLLALLRERLLTYFFVSTRP